MKVFKKEVSSNNYRYKPTIFYYESSILRIGWAILSLSLIIFILLFGISLGIRQVDHHYSKVECIEYGRVSSRNTKWVDVNFWTYDCFTQLSNGTWIRGQYKGPLSVEVQ